MNNKVFTPEIGQLITEIKINPSDGGIEIVLLFHTAPNAYQTLAQLLNGNTEEYFSSGFSSSSRFDRKDFEINHDGRIKVCSVASTENLKLMRDTWWEHPHSTEEWFTAVRAMEPLSKEEVTRIVKAFRLPSNQ